MKAFFTKGFSRTPATPCSVLATIAGCGRPRAILTLALGLSAAFAGITAQAAALYQVEIVVFTNPEAPRKETWPADIELALPRPLQLLRAADGIDPAVSADMNAYEHLPRTALALKNEAAALARSGRRILLHTAWRQPIGSNSNARNIYIEGGNRTEPFHELAGTLRFYRQQFVHVDTNLWLARFRSGAAAANGTAAAASWPLPPLPPQHSDNWVRADGQVIAESDGDIDALLNKEIAVERVVLMQQRRRLKQKELNYLDHPLFGALIMVVPYSAAAPAASASAQ
jgi:hypothetical protein